MIASSLAALGEDAEVGVVSGQGATLLSELHVSVQSKKSDKLLSVNGYDTRRRSVAGSAAKRLARPWSFPRTRCACVERPVSARFASRNCPVKPCSWEPSAAVERVDRVDKREST